jgi:hypothetical protein
LEFVGDINECLSQILSAIQTRENPDAEKMDWIKRGVFSSLLKVFQFCATENIHYVEMYNSSLNVC